jgi:IS30 family transposase
MDLTEAPLGLDRISKRTCEQTNGLLRQYYPKETDFADVSHHRLAKTVNSINDRPRQSLHYQTRSAVFHRISPSQGCN